MKRLFFLILIFSVILFNTDIYANKKASVSATASVQKVKAGEKFEVKLYANFESGWYTYALQPVEDEDAFGPTPTEITVEPSDIFEIAGKIKEPKPKKSYDKGFELDVWSYKGKTKLMFVIPVKAKKDIDLTKTKLEAVLYMQLCSNTNCLPPEEFKAVVKPVVAEEETKKEEEIKEDEVSEKLEEEEDTASQAINITKDSLPQTELSEAKDTEVDEKETADEESEDDEEESGLGFLWVSMAAGAAALLTPCVFPMVPITVSFFANRSKEQKAKGLRDAIVYALGIIVSFTLIGFLVSLIFGATGMQELIGNPWVNLAIFGIFIVFGLSLFGAYEIQMPTGLMNKLNAKSQEGSGLISVILMAVTFAMASFSCTGPLVAAALVSASQGDWINPIISMIGFSSVLAAPFFLLALFPTALNSLPRAGGWMNNIKAVLGFVVVAVSLKFLNMTLGDWGIALSRNLFLGIWVATGALTTLYVLGVFHLSHDTPVERVGVTRLLFALAFGSFTFFLISGFAGNNLGSIEAYLPAPEKTQVVSSSNAAEDKWYENYEEALAAAKKQDKPLFIDFTGKKCANCKVMERTVFTKPEIQERFGKMVKVKLVTDVRGEPYESNKNLQLEKYGTVALPMYVILTPDGKTIDKTSYTPDVAKFAEFLDKAFK